MPFLQRLIYLIDLAGSSRTLRYILVFLCITLLTLIYDLNGYKNLTTQEAMDTAQLGRNLAAGKGYTTQFIRPFSIFLLQRSAEKSRGAADRPGAAAVLSRPVPDISNAPLYPVVLAGLMKILPFDFSVNLNRPFWSVVDTAARTPGARRFWRYEPDFLIALFNQVLMVAVVVLAFFWARRMFDTTVAWTTALFLFGTELLWRFSVSGLATVLLMFIFMCLVWCLTWLEDATVGPETGRAKVLFWSAVAGLLVGLGGLAGYGFAVLVVPVLVWVMIYARTQAAPACLALVGAFVLVLGPWVARNFTLSNAGFGTATYQVLAGTPAFPGDHLDRSLNPNLQIYPAQLGRKLAVNGLDLFEKELFNLGGNPWLSALFLSGLMVGFRRPALRRLRHFLLLSFGALFITQALGRTQLSEDSPRINSENWLVLLLPLIVAYAVGMFYVLLDQIQFPAAELRVYAQALSGIVVCLPMASAVLLERTPPLAYPPYHPPVIQQTAAWLRPDELMMSDIPWAVAWYGNRPCVWLSLTTTPREHVENQHEDFYSLNKLKTVNALYLTPRMLDGRFLTDWVRTGDNTWGNFIARCLLLKDVPDDFPLHEMPTGFLPEQLFLSDSKRWQRGSSE